LEAEARLYPDLLPAIWTGRKCRLNRLNDKREPMSRRRGFMLSGYDKNSS
jgi:hypothetical protein